MGVPEMSLINRMLQDLDARRSEATASGELGQQVRAVPPAKKITPLMWGGAAAASIALLGAGWYLWHPAGASSDPALAQAPVQAPVIYHATSKMAIGKTQPVPSNSPQTAAAPAPVSTLPAQASSQEPAAVAPEPRILPLRLDTGLSLLLPPAETGRKTVRAEPADKPVHIAMPNMAEARQDRQEAPRVMPVVAKPADPIPGKQPKELTALQRAENEYRKAALALQQGKASEALNGFEQALFLDPLHAPARQAVISLMLERGQQDAAIRRAREGVALDPSQVGIAMILARLQVEKGELKSAIEVLEGTLRHAGDRADFHAFLAALLQRDERHKDAVDHYFAAVKQTPQSGVWWMGLGISLQAQQRNTDAQEAFRRAKATNSLSGELLSFVDGRLAQLQK
jgi:MSHA biogenesis protein MshN